MKVNAIEMVQHGKRMYLTKMKAGYLIDENIVKTDKWGRGNPEGYQREPSSSRCREFGKFVRRTKSVTPPSILLSVRAHGFGTKTFARVKW
jgi:hypothetical protein